jgi:hypothetical protein
LYRKELSHDGMSFLPLFFLNFSAMSLLISIIIVIVVFALVFWVVRDYLPIPQPFKNVILVIIVLALCLWLLMQLPGFRESF